MQGGLELFPLSIGQLSVDVALDENSHIVTLFSNITIQDSTLKEPATGNSTNAGVTVATILPGWESYGGIEEGTIFSITNSGFSNCVISNVNGFAFHWDNGFSGYSIQNCYVEGCSNAVYWEVPNPIYYGQNAVIQSNYFTNVDFGFLLAYNGISGYPTAVGSITLISNIIALTNSSFGAGFVIAGLADYAIPQIPSLTADYNQITTVNGDQEWGFYLWNIASGMVQSNFLNNTNIGLAVDDRFNRPNMPLSFLTVGHNTTGSGRLVNVAGGLSATNPPNFGTQQKGDFYLAGSPTLVVAEHGARGKMYGGR